MTTFPFTLVGFDLDGTLIDSAPDIAAAANHCLATIGRAPLSVDRIRPLMGGGARVLLRQALEMTGGVDQLDALYPELIAYYSRHLADLTRPFPGVVDALDALQERGVTLAVVTTKLEAPALAVLRELGLLDRFACVIGGDTAGLTAVKPDRAPIDLMRARCPVAGSAAFVGDTIYDVGAAKAAGIPVALFDPESKGALGADAAFAHFDQLIATLERIAI